MCIRDRTYKPNIADQRESPAVDLAKALLDLGAEVSFHDPHVQRWSAKGHIIPRAEDLTADVATADLVILVQNHREYDVDGLAEQSRRFFDTRGCATSAKAIAL